MAANPLVALVAALAEGSVRVVDLSQPLGPATPVIGLPPQFGQSAPLGMTEISRYDERGPAWYWNNLDARRAHRHAFRRAGALDHRARPRPQPHRHDCAGALRCSRLRDRKEAECARDPGFLLTVAHVEAWEARARANSDRRLGAAAQRLVEARGRGVPQRDRERAADAGAGRACAKFLAETRAVAGFGTECVGTDAGAGAQLRPAVSVPQLHARRQPFRAGEPCQSRPVAAHRCGADHAAAEDRERLRQPVPRARAGAG